MSAANAPSLPDIEQVPDSERPHVREFEQDGYTIFRGVLDPALIAEADAHVDWLLIKNPDLRPEQLHHELAQCDPFWQRLVSDDRLLDIAEQFIGPDIALFATHYICKPPRTGQQVLWHQDGVFWPLDPMRVVSLWLAVSDSSPDNGCLRVVPGTHQRELQQWRERTDVGNVLGAEIDADVDEQDAVDLALAPGDVSVHHPTIVHGSTANTSERWRRGLTIRYIPTSTRITDPEASSPLLLRGQAVTGINSYLARTPYDPARHMPFAGADAWS
jgi:ectoine hydroxylase-related dioxygenase (phytanoyl-CoA dioxygenase family)